MAKQAEMTVITRAKDLCTYILTVTGKSPKQFWFTITAPAVDYLGWHFYLTGTGKVVKRLRTQNKKKLKRRMKGLQKGYAEGRLEWEDIKRNMAATHGHLIHGHTYKLRKKLYNKTVFVRSAGNETEDVTI